VPVIALFQYPTAALLAAALDAPPQEGALADVADRAAQRRAVASRTRRRPTGRSPRDLPDARGTP
jgi:hypothetical protein